VPDVLLGESLSLEDVSEVPVALGACDFHPPHPHGDVSVAIDGPRHLVVEGGPPAPGVKLVRGVKEVSSTPLTGIGALSRLGVVLVELAGAGGFSACERCARVGGSGSRRRGGEKEQQGAGGGRRYTLCPVPRPFAAARSSQSPTEATSTRRQGWSCQGPPRKRRAGQRGRRSGALRSSGWQRSESWWSLFVGWMRPWRGTTTRRRHYHPRVFQRPPIIDRASQNPHQERENALLPRVGQGRGPSLADQRRPPPEENVVPLRGAPRARPGPRRAAQWGARRPSTGSAP